MGTYATYTSLQTLMIGTTFDTATTALATLCITHAENEINKYLSRRWDTSVFFASAGAVPPLVRSLCEDLSLANMYEKMSRTGKEPRATQIRTRVIDNLKDLRDYNANLFDTSGAMIASKTDGGLRILSTTKDYTETFNEDDPLNWAVDSDKLNDISDARD